MVGSSDVSFTSSGGGRTNVQSSSDGRVVLAWNELTETGSALKVVGMPTTILIDPDGREIGRLAGPAEWDSAEAKRLVEASVK